MSRRWWRHRPGWMPSVRDRAALDHLAPSEALAWVRNERRVYVRHDDRWRIL